MPTPWMIASRRPKKTKAKSTEIEEALMGSARVSRGGDGVLAIANSSEDTKYTMGCQPFERLFRRDAETSTRDACATRIPRITRGLNRAPKVCGKCRLISATSASSVVTEFNLRAVDKSSCHGSVNFFENFAHPVAELPVRIMRLKLSHIADPPDVIADAVGFLIGPG